MKRHVLKLIVTLAAACLASFAYAEQQIPPGYACATAHPLATQACMQVMAGGGNAFDAAVAASAAIAVVEPTGSGLGGGGFWLLHRAVDDLEVFIDGRETAPSRAQRNMYLDAQGKAIDAASRDGVLSAAIPGEPAALDHIAARYGSMPLAELLKPAIAFAREGFAVDAKLAQAIMRSQKRLSGDAPAVFMPNGQPLAEGALLRQADLAWTLEQIAAHGRDGFYAGAVAQRLIDAVERNQGLWSAEDLRHYAVIEREPLETRFRDYRIVSAPPPSAGGVALAQVFQQLEALSWINDGSAESQHLLIETLRRAYRDRAAYLGDPDYVSIPLQRLSGRSHALTLASNIDRQQATRSASLEPAPPLTEGNNTTHISVLDAAGNRVAATLSINLGFGSGFMAPGTGVLLNDEMDDFSAAPGVSNAYGLIGSEPNAVAANKRPLSSMTPTFVEGPRGLLVIGTPGGSRIITMVLQGILGWMSGLEASATVALPRMHHQYMPDLVLLEPGYADAERLAQLTAMGQLLRVSDSTWGNMQVISWNPRTGELQAASDPRGVGASAVKLEGASR
ncbi:MAG: gamma-glutamyltransferase [Pseudomonadota bacterium]|nr:gamma-glutamyltransferase [Pseudomonadota bacterium]